MDYSLQEYYEACHDGSSVEDSADFSGGDDMESASAWRAASGDSPLRGRARLTSPQHRSGLVQLRHQLHQDNERNPGTLRGQTAQRVVTALRCPLEGGLLTPAAFTGSLASAVKPTSMVAPSPPQILNEVLFDVLCALRQSPSRHCVFVPHQDTKSYGVVWTLAPQVRQQMLADGETTQLRIVDRLLGVATELSALRAQLEGFSQDIKLVALNADVSGILSEVTLAVDRAATTHPAALALAATSYSALRRLAVLLDGLLGGFQQWVLEVQELLVCQGAESQTAACTRSPVPRPSPLPRCVPGVGPVSMPTKGCRTEGNDGAANHRPQYGNDRSEVLTSTNLLAAVLHNLQPIQRGIVLLAESQCYHGLREWLTSLGVRNTEDPPTPTATSKLPRITTESFADQCTELATRLLDYLIVRVSALQDASTLDLYRWYMVVLLHCAWPYVCLTTAAIFGYVHDINPLQWRRRLPRLFRSSFAHTRVGDTHGQYPTDVLSLLSSCLGYQVGDPNTSSNCHGVGKVRDDRAAQTALRSARQFLLRSFATFASQKRRHHPRKEVHGSAPGLSLISAKDKPLKEILHDLLTAGDSGKDVEGAGLGLLKAGQSHPLRPVTEEETQPGAVQVESVASYSTVVPLAFIATATDVPGQAGYRQRVARRVSDEEGEGDEEGVARRVGSLWSLRLSEPGQPADIQLVCVKGGRSSCSSAAFVYCERESYEKNLWLNTSIPAARWLTAALLVPIGVVVQRLQARRLQDLFRTSAVRRSLGSPGDHDHFLDGAEVKEDDEEEEELAAARRAYVQNAAGGRRIGPSPNMRIPSHFSFMQAVKLLVDIALCRDKARIVDGFLERLYKEPHWWYRQADAAAVATYESVGTASALVSSLFADAVRGKRYGDLVGLAVRPKAPVDPDIGGGTSSALLSRELLDVFASFELLVTLPSEVALVLLPREMSRYTHSAVENNGNPLESTYAALFWERRRRVRLDVTDKAKSPESLQERRGGLQSSDVWSYVFGYMCAMHYTQIALRERRKQLRQQDVEDHALMGVVGRPTPVSGVSRLQLIARGLGSAYHSLSFVVDSLMIFTQRAASVVIYRLEHLFASVESINSVMQLCVEVDTLLLPLQIVCFPFRPPEVEPPGAVAKHPCERIRQCINEVLGLALDPSRLPVKLIGTRSRNVIEALVATVSGLHEPALLKTQLQPLVALLTFNHYYGTDDTTFQFN